MHPAAQGTSADSLTRKDYVDSKASVGISQTWQNVTARRVMGTNYTNNTGRPIQVSIILQSSAGTSVGVLYVEGIQVATAFAVFNVNTAMLTAIIPVGATYSVQGASGAIQSGGWFELR